MTTTTGTVASVTLVTLGDTLIADAAIGATTITVDDTSDFDGENGGVLELGGAQYSYTAVDDDTGIITLAAPLPAAALTDDRVDVWDIAAAAAAVECRALVSMPDDVDGGDTVDAIVSHPLVPLLGEGIRDPGTGETVTLEHRDGEWIVTDIRGKTPQFEGSMLRPGSVPVGAMSFQVGSTTVTTAAAAPTTPNVGDLWIDTTSDNQLNQWNGTAWAPLQFGTDAIAAGSITSNLIAANAIVAQNIAAGALDAVTISAVSVVAGSLSAGNIGSSVLDSSDITDSRYLLAADDTYGALLVYALSGQTSTTLSTPGASTWTVPVGVTSAKVECWAAGGSGSGSPAGGFGGQAGGGGEYARENNYPVTAGANIPVQIGAGGVAATGAVGTSGGDTSFDNAVIAHGGAAGGQVYQVNGAHGGSGSTNSIHFSGGVGHNAGGTFGTAGGGGGSSGGSAKTGGSGGAPSGTTGGPGGTAPTGGGAGGKGGNAGSTGQVGTAGSAPGGGGGGGGSGTSARAGGNGANGRIKITYGGALTLVASIAGAAGVDQYGNAYPAGVWVKPVSVAATTAMSASSGQSITGGSLYRSGNVIQINVGLTLPFVAVPASGNVTNTQIATINDVRYRPVVSAGFTGGSAGPVINGYIDTSGAVFITAIAPTDTSTGSPPDITAGTAQTINATFLTADAS